MWRRGLAVQPSGSSASPRLGPCLSSSSLYDSALEPLLILFVFISHTSHSACNKAWLIPGRVLLSYVYALALFSLFGPARHLRLAQFAMAFGLGALLDLLASLRVHTISSHISQSSSLPLSTNSMSHSPIRCAPSASLLFPTAVSWTTHKTFSILASSNRGFKSCPFFLAETLLFLYDFHKAHSLVETSVETR